MPLDTNFKDKLGELRGKNVVVDTDGAFLYLGRLKEFGGDYLLLEEADVHSTDDSSSSRELYVHDSGKHGVRPNRRTVILRLDRVLSLSPLEDVINY